MSVLIQRTVSKSKKINFNDAQNMTIIKNIEKDFFFAYTCGFFVSDVTNKKIYVITTYEPSRKENDANVIMHVNKKISKLSATYFQSVPEFGIDIYSVKFSSLLLTFAFDVSSMSYTICTPQNARAVTIINHKNVKGGCEHEEKIEIRDIKFDSVYKSLLVDIPIYNCTINHNVLPGSPMLTDNNLLIGYYTSYTDGTYHKCVPTYAIKYAINLINNNISISNLRSLFIKTKLMEMEVKGFHDNSTKIIYGHEIESKFGLKYSKNTLKKKSVIVRINNYDFDRRGYIYDKRYEMYLPLNTYMLLNNETQNYLIEYYKDDFYLAVYEPIDYKKKLFLNLEKSDTYYVYNGIVLTELYADYIEQKNTTANKFCVNVKKPVDKIVIVVECFNAKFDLNTNKIVVLEKINDTLITSLDKAVQFLENNLLKNTFKFLCDDGTKNEIEI